MRILGRITGALDWLAGWVILASMFLVAGNVAFRPFGHPIAGTYEWTGFLTALAIGLALSHCAARDGHTAIMLLVERFPSRARKAAMTVVRLLVAGVLFLSAWRLYLYALAIRASGEVAPTTEIPFWPITLVVAGGLLIYAVVELAKVFHLIAWASGAQGVDPWCWGVIICRKTRSRRGRSDEPGAVRWTQRSCSVGGDGLGRAHCRGHGGCGFCRIRHTGHTGSGLSGSGQPGGRRSIRCGLRFQYRHLRHHREHRPARDA